MSLSLTEFQAALDSTTTGYGRALLLTHATAAGTDYLNLYHKHFPVADQANEQPKTQHIKSMKFELNITADDKVLDAINHLATAISGRPSAPASVGTCGVQEATVTPTPETSVAEIEVVKNEEPAPKKKREPKPEKLAPVTTPEPEPEPEEVVPTGTELVALMSPLKDTSYTATVKEFKASLGFGDTLLKNVEDKDALKQLHAKIQECLATHKAEEV